MLFLLFSIVADVYLIACLIKNRKWLQGKGHQLKETALYIARLVKFRALAWASLIVTSAAQGFNPLKAFLLMKRAGVWDLSIKNAAKNAAYFKVY